MRFLRRMHYPEAALVDLCFCRFVVIVLGVCGPSDNAFLHMFGVFDYSRNNQLDVDGKTI